MFKTNLNLSSTLKNPSSESFELSNLGVTNEQLAKSPDLKPFLQNIYKSMIFFNHKVKVLNNEPALLVNNQYQTWSKIKELLENDKVTMLPHGWRYVEEGIQKQNLFKWEKLTPCWKDRKEGKEGRYYLDIISDVKKSLGAVSRHSYINLVDQNRDVYSVGLCSKKYKLFPFRSQKGNLMSPDAWEVAEDKNQISTRIELLETEFNLLKEKLENDQKTGICYHIINNNCFNYTANILKTLGIDLYENDKISTDNLTKDFFDKLSISPSKGLFKVVSSIIQGLRIVLSVFCMFLLLILGYFHKDSKAPSLQPQSKNLFSITMPYSMFKFAAGWKIIDWQNKVEEARQEYRKSNPQVNPLDLYKVSCLLPNNEKQKTPQIYIKC